MPNMQFNCCQKKRIKNFTFTLIYTSGKACPLARIRPLACELLGQRGTLNHVLFKRFARQNICILNVFKCFMFIIYPVSQQMRRKTILLGSNLLSIVITKRYSLRSKYYTNVIAVLCKTFIAIVSIATRMASEFT